MNLHRAASVANKEWREILRDKLMLTLAFVVPISMMVLISYGTVVEVKNVPLGIIDRDGSALSRDFAYRFMNSRYFDFKGYIHDDREVPHLLTAGFLRAVVIIPENFQRDLESGRPTGIQSLLDGTFPHSAMIVKAYVNAISNSAAIEVLANRVSTERGIAPQDASQLLQPFRVEVRYLYNESLKSDWSLPPRVIMFILFVTPAFMTSIRFSREKESGSIYNIYASTVTRAEFLLGKLAPYVAIFLFDGMILWLLATGMFGAPFRGSLACFLVATTFYVVISSCLGVLVSFFVKTQMAAMVIAMFVTYIPAWQYAGLDVPVTSLRPEAQCVAHLMIAMYYTDVINGTFLKAAGLQVLWPDLLILASYSMALFALCCLLFRKRVQA